MPTGSPKNLSSPIPFSLFQLFLSVAGLIPDNSCNMRHFRPIKYGNMRAYLENEKNISHIEKNISPFSIFKNKLRGYEG